VSEFKRENKYIVIKLSKLNDNPILRNKQLNELNFFSDAFVESVVVESNKPEYQDVWAMVQARIEGKVNELNSLRQQLTKPADDTITVSKEEWEAVIKNAKRWEIARTLGVAVVNDKGNITGAHFNEGADQRVDKAIQGESE
jgi:hypothetical protein